VIRSEIRSRAERNCALPLFLHPSHQRDTAHRPVGTGRLRARRRFGYWGGQIGHPCDQRGHHFGARRQNSSLQPRVGVETAMAVGSTQAARVRSHERFRRMSSYGMAALGAKRPLATVANSQNERLLNALLKDPERALSKARRAFASGRAQSCSRLRATKRERV
jgi:hypothetical protein